jgi:hypothetical protein
VGSNPYIIVNNAYEGIPCHLNLEDGLQYGLKELDWDESDKYYLEELTIWVVFHQIKRKLICFQA